MTNDDALRIGRVETYQSIMKSVSINVKVLEIVFIGKVKKFLISDEKLIQKYFCYKINRQATIFQSLSWEFRRKILFIN